jgi:predicted N-acetyltransferase YhbS
MNDGNSTGAEAPPRWTIRPGGKRDWRAARMLLPQAVHLGCGCAVLVANDAQGHVIGAAALSPRMRTDPVPGSLIAVHVVPPWRRRGIARSLVEQFARILAARGGEALYAWDPVVPDGEDAAAWRALGFDRGSSFHRTRVATAEALAQLESYERRMRERGWIPDGAAVVPLADADASNVAALNVAHLGGTTDDLLSRLRGEVPQAYDAQLSLIVTVDDEVRGSLLARVVEPGVALIEANTVDPAARGRWANVLLRVHAGRLLLDNGLATVVFDTRDPHADTRRIAEKLGADTVRMIEPYRLVRGGAATPFHG